MSDQMLRPLYQSSPSATLPVVEAAARNVRLRTVEFAADFRPSGEAPCGALLRQGLPGLGVFTAAQAAEDGPARGDPFAVEVVPNPRAWGNFPANRPVRVLVPSDSRSMHLTLHQEVEAGFALGGWRLVDEVAIDVFGLDRCQSVSATLRGGAHDGWH